MTDTALLLNILTHDKTGPGLHSAEGGFDKLGEKIKHVAELAGIAFSVEKVIEFGKSTIEAAEEAEKANKLTEAAIKSTGGTAGLTAEQVGTLAEKLSEHNAVSQEAVHTSENLLLTFTNIRDAGGKAGGTFDKASQAVIDMTAAMNHGDVSMDNVKATSLQVGKALNDPIKGMSALQRVGVAFSDQQKKTIKDLVDTGHGAKAQTLILKELEREFGGAAAKMATPMDRARVAMHNASVTIGTALLPEVSKFSTWIADKAAPGVQHLVTNLQHGQGTWASWRGALAGAAHGLETIAGGLEKVGGFLAHHETLVEAILVGMGTFITLSKVWAATSAVAAFATGGWTTAFWALDAAMTANPVGAVIVGVGLLAAGLVFAWKKSETFREVVAGVFNALTTVVADAAHLWVNVVLGAWDALLQGAAHAFGWIPGIGGKLKGAANAFSSFKDNVNASIDAIHKDVTMHITADGSQAIAEARRVQEAMRAAIEGVTGKPFIGPIIPGTTVQNGRVALPHQAPAPKLDVTAGGVPPAVFSTGAGSSGSGAAATKKAAAKEKAQDYGRLIGLAIARGLTDSATGIQSTFTRILDSLDAGGRTAAAAAAKTMESQMLALARRRDAIEDKLKADRLGKLKADAADYAHGIRASFDAAADVTSLAHAGGTASQQIADLTRLRDHAVAFAAAIGKLRKMHLGESTIAQLVAAGPEGGLGAAQQLINEGAGGIARVNALTGQIDAAGARLGGSEAQVKYGAAEARAAADTKALIRQETELVKAMRKLAVKVEVNVAGTDKELLALIRKMVRVNGGTATKAFG